MSVIERLPEIVYPLTQVNKVNEIVDVLNLGLNSSYTEENPLLTPSTLNDFIVNFFGIVIFMPSVTKYALKSGHI